MNYQEWVEHFGRTAEDPALKEKLRQHGVTKHVVMPRDDLYLLVDLPGMTLNFQDVELFEGFPPVGSGNCLLTGVALHLVSKKAPYDGPLPLDIKQSESQEELRTRLKEPVEVDEGVPWDRWNMSKTLSVTVEYAKDRKSVKSMLVSIPEAD